MMRFSQNEKALLSLPVPGLGLPMLPDDANDFDFAARAEAIGAGPSMFPGERNIRALLTLLGTFKGVSKNVN